jgi:retron-type reverse transcriptase
MGTEGEWHNDGSLSTIADNRMWKEFFDAKKGSYPAGKVRYCRRLLHDRDSTDIIREISRGEHVFSIPKKTQIGKPNSNKKRSLYAFNNVETMALRLVAYNMQFYDSLFSRNLFSFRNGYGLKEAMSALRKSPGIGQMYGYKMDIHDYFNTVDVDILLDDLDRTIEDKPLVNMYRNLLSGEEALFEGEVIREKKGVMAGIPVAPFLSNYYLREMDFHFSEKDCYYFRYADDILLMAKTDEEAKGLHDELLSIIESKGLTINPDKEKHYVPGDVIEFLGCTIVQKGNTVIVEMNYKPPAPSEKKAKSSGAPRKRRTSKGSGHHKRKRECGHRKKKFKKRAMLEAQNRSE